MTESTTTIRRIRAQWTDALAELDRARAFEIGNAGLQQLGPAAFGDAVIAPTLQELGQRWQHGALSLAEVYVAGRISAELVGTPDDADADASMAIALLDDFHGLGKSLVLMSLRASGLHVKDFGTMGAEALAERVIAEKTELLFVSTLMLRSALHVADLVAALRAGGATTLVYAGGAPFRMDEGLWRRVGADGYGRDAADAVRIARDWLARRGG